MKTRQRRTGSLMGTLAGYAVGIIIVGLIVILFHQVVGVS